MNRNDFTRRFYYAMGPKWMRRMRKLFYAIPDLIDRITGKRPEMVPPRGMIFTGSGDFISQGEKFLTFFKEAGLQPNHRVLDIGCGVGRMARPLTSFLHSEGDYRGIDIVEEGIQWCTQHIQTRHPNFQFQLIPLKNSLYRNKGENAESVIFPFPANSFDFIFLTSVFTHMPEKEVLHYLEEIQRLLVPGGRCFATFFLLDDISKRQMETRQDVMKFPYHFGSYALHHLSVDAANIAFEKEILIKNIKEKFYVIYDWPGMWCKRPDGKDFQDILVLEKPKLG